MLSTSDLVPPSRLPRWWVALIATALLSLHAWLALSAAGQKSATADEVAHLCSGHVYWAHSDYRLHPENGILTQRWEGLPGFLLGWKLPGPEHPGWARADIWTLGDAYFHRLGNPLDRMLFWGRAMNLFWSLGTGLLILFWSRRLFGDLGGIVSLCFFVFCPTFLAHGPLATSDMVMTFFFLACSGAFWRGLQCRSKRALLLSSLLFGLACVAKFSAILLIPMFCLMAVAWLARSGKEGLGDAAAGGRWRWLALLGLAHVGSAFLIIWLFYGFRHSPVSGSLPPMTDYFRSWIMIRESLGARGELLWTISQWKLLPDPFVFGFAHVVSLSEMRSAFFNGEHSLTGWLLFFPYAFLVKTPLGFLGACALCTGLALREFKLKRLHGWIPLLVLLAVYGVFALTSKLNIGHRHILPLYPPLFILAGLLGAWCDRRSVTAILATALLLLAHITESMAIRPHYLAFFNPISGGPAQGYRHLVDSSLDWGQDLPALSSWLKENRKADTPVFLSYFGTDKPSQYGVEAYSLPHVPSGIDRELWAPLQGGLYCISASMLQNVLGPLPGPWTLEREREYQELRKNEILFYVFARSQTAPVSELGDEVARKWLERWKNFNHLRFERLCLYLRNREPDANAGYSILIYRLSEDEVKEATAASYSSLLLLIEKTRTSKP